MYKGGWIVEVTYHSEAGDVDVEISLARPPGQAVKTLEAADKSRGPARDSRFRRLSCPVPSTAT